MPVREFFHLMQTVDDFDAAEAFFAELLGARTYLPKGWSDLDKRWASLARVGDDFVLELMQVSTDPDDSASPLPRFRARHGKHFHSLAWLVDRADMQGLLDELRTNGVRVVTVTGAVFPAEGPAEVGGVMFTHPKDTHGLIELMGMDPVGYPNDPLFEAGWSPAFWRDEHPLGILRTSHFTNMVGDMDHAKRVYGLLGGSIFHEREDAEATRCFVFVGNQTVVQLVQPKSTASRIGRDQSGHGDMVHSVTFAVGDLDAVEAYAAKLGVRVADRDDSSLVLDPDDCYGGVFGFTTAAIPDDPRGPA